MTRTLSICLLTFILLTLVSVGHSLSKGEGMDQSRPNKLDKLYFIPKTELIVGSCDLGPNGSIKFWSVDDGKLVNILHLEYHTWAHSLAASNDGNLIAAGLMGKEEITCYSLKEKKWLWRVKMVGEGVLDDPMGFTVDDRKLVVVGIRNIVTFDVKSGIVLQKENDSKFFGAGFSNCRTRIGAISPSARYAAFWQGYPLAHGETWLSRRNIWVVVRDIEKGKVIAKQGKIQKKYKNCSAIFTPDEKNLVLGSTDGFVRIWSMSDQKVVREWRAYGAGEELDSYRDPFHTIESICFSAARGCLATMGFVKGSFDIKIWDYTTNKLIHEFKDVISSSVPACSGYPMAFSPDGKYFALEQQGRLSLYDTQTWQKKWSVPSWAEDK